MAKPKLFGEQLTKDVSILTENVSILTRNLEVHEKVCQERWQANSNIMELIGFRLKRLEMGVVSGLIGSLTAAGAVIFLLLEMLKV